MKDNLSKKEIESSFNRFFDLLFENKNAKNIGQELERGNPDLDNKIKQSSLNKFKEVLPFIKNLIDLKTIEDYYSNYGKRDLFKESIEEFIGLNKLKTILKG